MRPRPTSGRRAPSATRRPSMRGYVVSAAASVILGVLVKRAGRRGPRNGDLRLVSRVTIRWQDVEIGAKRDGTLTASAGDDVARPRRLRRRRLYPDEVSGGPVRHRHRGRTTSRSRSPSSTRTSSAQHPARIRCNCCSGSGQPKRRRDRTRDRLLWKTKLGEDPRGVAPGAPSPRSTVPHPLRRRLRRRQRDY